MIKNKIKLLSIFCLLLSANNAIAESYEHTLYYAPGAASIAPEILLKEMNKPIKLEEIDLASHTVKKDGSDYYKINPTGMVPAITLEDDKILTETSVILQYFADQDKSHKFLPEIGTNERYYVLEKLNFVATEIHKSIGGWFMSDKKFFSKKLKTHLKQLDNVLADNDFLANNKLSIADFYFTTSLFELKNLLKMDLKEFKNVDKYFNRMKEQQSVMTVLKKEGLGKWLR